MKFAANKMADDIAKYIDKVEEKMFSSFPVYIIGQAFQVIWFHLANEVLVT